MRIIILGNYMPRRCGIATFTTNLANSILAANDKKETNNEVLVVAMNDHDQIYEYPDIVKYTIKQQEPNDYNTAANFINGLNADVCIFQHEFGIFGGESGVYALRLLQQLKMPIITTLHTILQTPSYHEKHILKKIGHLSQKLIVMSHLAIDFLTTIYEIPLQKIEFIHHGVPDFSNVENTSTKFNYSGKKVLGTFGFLGRSKGIETVINALPKVVNKHPNVIYVVLGQTHPNVKKHSNEEYRDYLKDLAESNNVANNVIFEDDFLEEEDIKSFLVESDIYITPYLNEAQITSGTICYAIGAGACIVSTPFWHAKELLADNRGKTFAFGNSDDLAETLCDLLDNPEKIAQIKEAAFNYGKKLYWNKIGLQYIKELNKINNTPLITHDEKPLSLPKFSMDHIKRLTDDMGILEHANYSIPDYKEGYCLDDNSRALLLVLMAYELGVDKNSIGLADVYLRYIKLMQMEDGFFHNDMSYEKKFLDEKGSEDSFGRTIWAMGYLIRLAPNDSHFQFAKDTFFKAYHHFEKITSIRAIASIIIGFCHFLKRYPDNENIIHLMNSLTYKLLNQYKDESDNEWKWFEPILCYDNAIIPLALWHAYDRIKDKEIFDVASKSTDFLDKETYKKDRISLVGNTWYYKGKKRPAQGQQPINAMAMIMMYSKAFEVTKEIKYHERMLVAFSWFTGNNDLFIPLYDEESKGCCDGLETHCVNRNQGAESTISYLLSYLTVWSSKQAILKASQNLLTEDEILTT
ncbi:glycosyltransferase family 4 protein [Flavivirga aquimarina]|uniref:Glycosyltransferase family 4 protein n=1 Tax=Flavivirga aquimarina TaxID=2027862 RepID=A0ABT8WF09_9FLAO|nr:glycosyltransferase family 4 protein [Flavivirga aquimarina]MDO5971591.1 glycosyltransferase family 4 protein [Flavivirga aquimarina]